MQITFQPISLDATQEDADAVMIFRDARLLAIASRLSSHHGPDNGRFYVEAIFGARDQHVGTILGDEDELRGWAETIDEVRGTAARMRA